MTAPHEPLEPIQDKGNDILSEKISVSPVPSVFLDTEKQPTRQYRYRKLPRRVREEREKKVARKGWKSMRGKPEAYDELKKVTTISITTTGLAGLDCLARTRNLSRSELVEQIGRGKIQVHNLNLSKDNQE